MMLPAARRLDIDMFVLDPDPECPACAGASRAISGDFAEYDAVLAAAAATEPDAVTIEIEHVNTEAMAEIARRGVPVRPGAEVVAVVNDKLRQRRRLEGAALPMPRFVELPEEPQPANADRAASGLAATLEEFGLPAVQKLRFGGYDGRGVAVIREPVNTLPLKGPSMLEAHVPIETELSVIVARTPGGSAAVYEPFEMDMDSKLHLVQAVIYPASLDPGIAAKAQEVALAAAEALRVVGICAVELFLTSEGRILLNEVAPRPHNSGHLTLEASETDQFEQHLRAIFDLPLGSTEMRTPAVMRNLVGRGAPGPARWLGVEETLAIPGVHLHQYGKADFRPGRKMGHLTACAGSLELARQRAAEAARILSIVGQEEMG